MKLKKTILTLAIILVACKENPCMIMDIKNIKWEHFDDIASYYICSPSNIKLTATDSFNVSYSGILNSENEITKSSLDSSVFNLLTHMQFGTFHVGDSDINIDIKQMVNKMGKNSECIVKYQLSNISTKPANNKA